jgi:hypothetical protein
MKGNQIVYETGEKESMHAFFSCSRLFDCSQYEILVRTWRVHQMQRIASKCGLYASTLSCINSRAAASSIQVPNDTLTGNKYNMWLYGLKVLKCEFELLLAIEYVR